ncbi:methyltransferase domain-containing protein [Candidatus Planktophila lacus]|uniref:Methyltransferase n=1 Tax=Candidatus Planktophila lacus TaxID=1884913 RepID=A0AAD0E418_9ACTN|nr:methyltransferase domain-containing protein [Candidatus Planktophila lacus]ASY10025.1 methyltransferase [Candidatus Planktophila lacus]
MEIFQGKFESLETALREQKFINPSDAFSTERWKTRQQLFLDMSREGISPRHSSLVRFLEENEQIEIVLDIGGGSGWIFHLLRARIQRPLTYINLEIKEICDEFSKEFKETHLVQFVDSWEPIFRLEKISLVYSNSTLQYISDEIFFENFKKIHHPQYLVLDDFIATSSQSYWTLQNYYGNFIPYCFRNLNEFNQKLLAQGYSVVSAEDYPQTLASGFDYGSERMPQTMVYKLL